MNWHKTNLVQKTSLIFLVVLSSSKKVFSSNYQSHLGSTPGKYLSNFPHYQRPLLHQDLDQHHLAHHLYVTPSVYTFKYINTQPEALSDYYKALALTNDPADWSFKRILLGKGTNREFYDGVQIVLARSFDYDKDEKANDIEDYVRF